MKKELGDKCEISEHSLRKSVKQLYDSIYKWLDHGCLRGVDNFIDDIQNIADYFEFMSSVVDVKPLWLKSLQPKKITLIMLAVVDLLIFLSLVNAG